MVLALASAKFRHVTPRRLTAHKPIFHPHDFALQRDTNHQATPTTATMSRPTVTVISPKGESSKDTIAVPNVFKVSHDLAWTERHGCWADLQDLEAEILQDTQQ
jgi:hypothetical protein